MKTLKKSLAILLAALMALSVFAVAAFAADDVDENPDPVFTLLPTADSDDLANNAYWFDFEAFIADNLAEIEPEYAEEVEAGLREAIFYISEDGNTIRMEMPDDEEEPYTDFTKDEDPEFFELYLNQHGWVAIPASAEGLETGAYYLDFSAYEYGDLFGSFSFLFNEEEFKLKTTDGEDFSFLLASMLKQVGVNWVKAKLPGEAKAAGDYYVDMTASEWAPYAAVMKEVYVNTVASSVFKVRIVSVSQEYGESEVIEPLFDKAMNPDEATMYLMIANKVKLYEGGQDTPGTDDTPGNNDNGSSGNFFTNLWAKIVSFFQKIVDFFKNLFKK